MSTTQSNYRQFFMESERISSKVGKKAMVLDPQMWTPFFKMLLADVKANKVDLEFAASISVSISMGLRVGELQMVKVSMINLKDRSVRNVPVLKKRGQVVTRSGLIHESAKEIVEMSLMASRKRPTQFFTKENRQSIDRSIKKYFGSDEGFDHHSLARHSFASLLVENKFEGLKIASVMKLRNPEAAYRYVHTHSTRDLEDLFKAA